MDGLDLHRMDKDEELDQLMSMAELTPIGRCARADPLRLAHARGGLSHPPNPHTEQLQRRYWLLEFGREHATRELLPVA
jgi:hypothetical protein